MRRCAHEGSTAVRHGTEGTQLEVPAPADAAGSHELIAKLQSYIDVGVTHMILDCGVVTDPDRVRRLGEDVLARFR